LSSSRPKYISNTALAILSLCRVQDHNVYLPKEQLDRKLYSEVNDVLMRIGGKWNTKAKAHVFDNPQSEILDMLEGCIQTGIAEPMVRNGFFPTQPAEADKLVAMADLGDDMRILEPSAGSGNLIEAIKKTGKKFSVVAVDVDPMRIAELRERFKGNLSVYILNEDFMKWNIGIGVPFERIIMNPPFSLPGYPLLDIDHVMHAWEFLAPGGKLVAIMSLGVTFRREKKVKEFQAHVERYGRLEFLPEDAFKASGTLVKTVRILLQKPK
jgi:predicted RNA methylase